MTDLHDFLLARIAEDEERARALAAAYERDEVRPPARLVNLFALVVPRSVLAECDAKRQIVEQYAPAVEVGGAELRLLEWVLSMLALSYADHPDYRQEWKP